MESLITFIATAFNEPFYNKSFITSIMMQTDKNFNAIVWNNGLANIPDNVIDNDILYRSSERNTGNWGTANRQQAIDECTTEYIIQTSVQDYWLPQSVEYINKVLDEHKPDILIWNSVNHLVGPCQVLDSTVAWSKIDWGNFALRTDIARKVRIRQSEYCSDFLYLQDLIQGGHIDPKKIMKLPLLLTIHN